eukprot:scaffold13863_cov59-Attheya_sp.AAC.5
MEQAILDEIGQAGRGDLVMMAIKVVLAKDIEPLVLVRHKIAGWGTSQEGFRVAMSEFLHTIPLNKLMGPWWQTFLAWSWHQPGAAHSGA